MRTPAEQKEESDAILRRDYLRFAKLPKRHLDIKPENPPYEWQNALQSILACLGTGFLMALIGPRGTGKTQLAVEAVRSNAQNLRTSRYNKAIEVFVRIKGTYRDDPEETEKQAIDALCRPSLLILDEMSERGESEWEERMLRLIIDRRYDNKQDTLLIGNFKNAEALAASVGDSIASRIQETGGVITCNWKSFRG